MAQIRVPGSAWEAPGNQGDRPAGMPPGTGPQTVLLVTTDPPEPLADIARNLAGHNRVVSTSTYLDSVAVDRAENR